MPYLKKKAHLTLLQLRAIELMSQIWEDKSNREIIAELGINEATFYKWQHVPLFQEELTKALTENRYYIRSRAWKALNRLIEKDVFKAVELYFKMTGEFVPAELRANMSLVAGGKNEFERQDGRKMLLKIIKAIGVGGVQKGELFERLLKEANESIDDEGNYSDSSNTNEELQISYQPEEESIADKDQEADNKRGQSRGMPETNNSDTKEQSSEDN